MKLTADFYPVAVWIDYHAFIVTIAGASRTIDNRESIVPQTLCELIDQALRAYRDREMGQPKALYSGRIPPTTASSSLRGVPRRRN